MEVKINGIPLPKQAVEFEFRRLMQFYAEHLSGDELKAQHDQLMARAREQAIGAKLLMDEAHRLDLSVPEDVYARERAKVVHRSGGEDALKQQLAEQNIPEDEFDRSLRESCKVNVFIEQICSEVPDPTEAEMEAHFEAHRDEYQTPERASAQHILIKPASENEDDRDVARSKMLELREQLLEGDAEFSDLAEMHSECPSGKQTGGSLGWFSRGMMVPEFDNAVFSMSVDELSDVIQTQFGYHLIYKTGHEEVGTPEFSEVADKVREFLRHVRRGEAISAFVQELRNKVNIEYDEQSE